MLSNSFKNVCLLAGILSIASIHLTQAGENIHQWRGPNDGKFNVDNVQTIWSASKNVKWKTPMPDWGNASPIVVGNKIFICSEPDEVICLDKNSGEILWKKSQDYLDVMDLSDQQKQELLDSIEKNKGLQTEVDEVESKLRRVNRILKRDPKNKDAKKERSALENQLHNLKNKMSGGDVAGIPSKPKSHTTNGYTSYTPVTDGAYVYVSTGLGTVAAYDLDGKRIWAKKMAIPDHDVWGGSTSPVLAGGHLIVRFRDWVALDPKTGKEKWREPAYQVFGTPAVFQIGGKDILFSPKGDIVGAEDGALYAREVTGLAKKDWWSFNKPVVDDGFIYTAHGKNGNPTFIQAFEIPGNVEALKNWKPKWELETDDMRFYSSLLVHDGLVYAVGNTFELIVIDAATGEKLSQQKLKGLTGNAYPSIALAGENLFVSSDSGQTAVIKPGKSPEVLNTNELEPFRSSPVFIGAAQYVRGYEHFYVIE